MPAGIRHAHDCPEATGDPWQEDAHLVRTLIRVREDGRTASYHYRCRHCQKAAIRVEPYKEGT